VAAIRCVALPISPLTSKAATLAGYRPAQPEPDRLILRALPPVSAAYIEMRDWALPARPLTITPKRAPRDNHR